MKVKLFRAARGSDQPFGHELMRCLLGGTVYQLLCAQLPTIGAMVNASAIDLIVGAPGWWVSRAVALWFQRRSDKDITELVKDAKEH